jgi:hypothetical protein
MSWEQELRLVRGSSPPSSERYTPASTQVITTETKPEGTLSAQVFIAFPPDLSYAKLQIALDNDKCSTITGISLHIGTAAVNGESVVDVLSKKDLERLNRMSSSAKSIRKTIKNRHIKAFAPEDRHSLVYLQVNSVASLYQAIERGFVYVNLRTNKNPEGALRGQLLKT